MHPCEELRFCIASRKRRNVTKIRKTFSCVRFHCVVSQRNNLITLIVQGIFNSFLNTFILAMSKCLQFYMYFDFHHLVRTCQITNALWNCFPIKLTFFFNMIYLCFGNKAVCLENLKYKYSVMKIQFWKILLQLHVCFN